MFLVGAGLIAIAVVAFIVAKPRDGVPKLAGKPFLETVVALMITITGALGVVVDFYRIGIAVIRIQRSRSDDRAMPICGRKYQGRGRRLDHEFPCDRRSAFAWLDDHDRQPSGLPRAAGSSSSLICKASV